MNTEYIHVEENDGVLFIKMDDPKTRNALGSDMSDEINDQLDRLESDPNLRVLVLSGEDPSFCSGANVIGFALGPFALGFFNDFIFNAENGYDQTGIRYSLLSIGIILYPIAALCFYRASKLFLPLQAEAEQS